MIKYALVCDKGHDFESWFADSAAYDKQAKKKLIACPLCGSPKVDKAIMAPAVSAISSEASIRQKGSSASRRPSASRRNCFFNSLGEVMEWL